MFSLTCTVSFLFKCHGNELQRSSCGSNILLQRSSCAVIMQLQRSSCGFQDSSSSDQQSAVGRNSSCECKKKFLRMHYFWAVLYLYYMLAGSSVEGIIIKYQNEMPKVAKKAFNIEEVWNPVCCHGNKTVELVLWSTFSRILQHRIKIISDSNWLGYLSLPYLIKFWFSR